MEVNGRQSGRVGLEGWGQHQHQRPRPRRRHPPTTAASQLCNCCSDLVGLFVVSKKHIFFFVDTAKKEKGRFDPKAPFSSTSEDKKDYHRRQDTLQDKIHSCPSQSRMAAHLSTLDKSGVRTGRFTAAAFICAYLQRHLLVRTATVVPCMRAGIATRCGGWHSRPRAGGGTIAGSCLRLPSFLAATSPEEQQHRQQQWGAWSGSKHQPSTNREAR